MSRLFNWLHSDKVPGRTPVRPWLLDKDRRVRWANRDQSDGMVPVKLVPQSTVRLRRLVRSAQLPGMDPDTDRCETSSTTRDVSFDHSPGSVPVMPVSPLTLR